MGYFLDNIILVHLAFTAYVTGICTNQNWIFGASEYISLITEYFAVMGKIYVLMHLITNTENNW